MVNVHARYLDVLEAEGWLDRGARVPADRQADRRAPGGRRRAADARVRRAHRLHEERQRRRDGAHRPARRRAARGRPGRATSRPSCASAIADAIRAPPAAPGDHRHRARQPDGQPVGHLVRPPDDRGHRRLGRRRDAGLGRRPATSSTSPTCGPRSTRSPGEVPLDIQLELFLDCRRMVERARCGCCATAARRSTSPRPSPSSSPASPSWPARWSRCSSGGWPTSSARSRRRG